MKRTSVLQVLGGASFGLMDGIICALGIIIGVAAATSNTTTVIIAGVIGGVADAFGNSIGFYISHLAERGVQKHEKAKNKVNHKIYTREKALLSGIASFLVTVLTFGVLLIPFVLLPIMIASSVSFAIAIVALAALGAYVAKLSRESAWKTSLWYACLGVAGAVVSYWVGSQLKVIFGTQ